MTTATIFAHPTFWFIFFCAVAGTIPNAQAEGGDDKAMRTYVQQVEQVLANHEVAGFSGAVLVAERGTVLMAEGYGWAQTEAEVPVMSGTAFDIGVFAKSFTVAAILQLEAEGQLNLNDPLHRYIKGTPTALGMLTVQQLLTEQAALPNLRLFARPGIDRTTVLSTIMKQAPRVASTTSPNQTHLSYLLLAAVVEDVSGQAFESYVRTAILTPAGLKETTFANETWRGSYLEAHSAAPSQAASEWVQWGFGGLRSTVSDLYRWQQVLHHSLLLSPEATQRLHAIVPEMLCTTTACETENSGFYTYAHFDKAQDRWIIVTSNTPEHSRKVVADIEALGVQGIRTFSAALR